jgi:hypothetical protein
MDVYTMMLLNDSALYLPAIFIWKVAMHMQMRPRIYRYRLPNMRVSEPFDLFS